LEEMRNKQLLHTRFRSWAKLSLNECIKAISERFAIRFLFCCLACNENAAAICQVWIVCYWISQIWPFGV